MHLQPISDVSYRVLSMGFNRGSKRRPTLKFYDARRALLPWSAAFHFTAVSSSRVVRDVPQQAATSRIEERPLTMSRQSPLTCLRRAGVRCKYRSDIQPRSNSGTGLLWRHTAPERHTFLSPPATATTPQLPPRCLTSITPRTCGQSLSPTVHLGSSLSPTVASMKWDTLMRCFPTRL